MRQILQQHGNTTCADCGAEDPDWAVHNIGCFVCIDCAGVHRKMGVDISKVRSTKFDTWTMDSLDAIAQLGNIITNQQYEDRKPSFVVGPYESDDSEIRELYIRMKYERRVWHSEQDEKSADPGTHPMPQKAMAEEFLMESGKKRVYIQLLGKFLYHFRAAHDSYSFEHFDVRSLSCHLVRNNNNHTILMISQNNDETLFRLRAKDNVHTLTKWMQAIRRATIFYNSPLAQTIRPRPSNAAPPLEYFENQHREAAIELGNASKKGGARHGWKMRWWCYYEGSLYYFGKDPSRAKKRKDLRPKGDVSLHGADVILDHDRSRTGKQNAIMICTHKRTFYVLPEAANRDRFYAEIDQICAEMWNRQDVDFVALAQET